MHPDDEKILIDYLETVKEDLILQQISEGIRNTGESARSLRVVKGGLSGTPYLAGSSYWQFLIRDQGRGPGRFPPVDKIEDWVLSKPVNLGDKTPQQMAFLIGRKIAESGTSIYQGRRGVNINKSIKKHLTPAVKRLAGAKADRYFQQLKRAVK